MAYQSDTDRALWDEQSAAVDALRAAMPQDLHQLIYRLSNTTCGAMASGEDRVLRIAGVLLAQHGLAYFFEQIFDAVFEGSTYTNGGAQGFLRDQLATLHSQDAES